MPADEDATQNAGSRHDREVRHRLPLKGPISSLSPTAQAILEAARDVLRTDGFVGLTVDVVTKRAGVNKAAISYHFGGKAGLVAAVVDATVHDSCLELLETTRQLPLGDERIGALIAGKQSIAENNEAYRGLFGVLPYLLTDVKLRRRMGSAYDWYRKTNLESLGKVEGASPEELQALARLLTAVVDGLAIQRWMGTGKSEVDLTEPFRLFGRMVSLILDDFGRTRASAAHEDDLDKGSKVV